MLGVDNPWDNGEGRGLLSSRHPVVGLHPAAAVDDFVVELFQFQLVHGFLAGEVAEQVADGAGGGGFGEFAIVLHGGVLAPHGVLRHGLVVGVVAEVGQVQAVGELAVAGGALDLDPHLLRDILALRQGAEQVVVPLFLRRQFLDQGADALADLRDQRGVEIARASLEAGGGDNVRRRRRPTASRGIR